MKSKSKTYYFFLILNIAGFYFKPCNVFGQVKYYNSVTNILSYNWTDTLSFYNFNNTPITNSFIKLKTLDYKLQEEKVSYSQFCDSSGIPILTRQYYSYYDKQANKIPLFFSSMENEILYTGFFTNKTKFVFALLAKYYRPEIETHHPGIINLMRFDKIYKLVDTAMIADDMYNWGQLFIEYSPNCDFNYL